MPAITYWGSWAIFAISFTISGIEKFASPLWRSGEAFGLLLTGPVALDNFLIDFLSSLPMVSVLLLTWVTLYSQLFAVVLVLFSYSRFVLWFVSTALFVAALPILDLLEVLLGMIIFFLFLFDAQWFTSKKHITVWIDSECPACSYFARLIKSENSAGKIAISDFFDPQLRKLISDQEIKAMKEMVVFDGERIHRGDEALIVVLVHLGGMWNLCRLLYLLPKPVRKKLYRVLARNRYRIKVCSV
jgi:predicted DCC family thiol-disulfide oxidoreductase YuxK